MTNLPLRDIIEVDGSFVIDVTSTSIGTISDFLKLFVKSFDELFSAVDASVTGLDVINAGIDMQLGIGENKANGASTGKILYDVGVDVSLFAAGVAGTSLAQTAGTAFGTWAGTKIGTAIGTAACPGLGTALGAVGGFIVGTAFSIAYTFWWEPELETSLKGLVS